MENLKIFEPTENRHCPREHLEKQEYAAVVLQAGFRGMKSRESMRKRNEAAAKIQALYRGHKARKDLQEKGRLSFTSKKSVSFSEQISFSSPTDFQRENAATLIQAAFRGYKVRKQSGWKKEDSIENEEIYKSSVLEAKIQAVSLIRTTLKGLEIKDSLNVEEKIELKLCNMKSSGTKKKAEKAKVDKNSAATLIQSTFRGFLVRKKLN